MTFAQEMCDFRRYVYSHVKRNVDSRSIVVFKGNSIGYIIPEAADFVKVQHTGVVWQASVQPEVYICAV